MRAYLIKAKSILHQAHLRELAARFTDQKANGLTVRVWCESNQIPFHKYNYRKHILKEEVVDQTLPDIIPLLLPASALPSAQASQPFRTNRAIRTNYINANVRFCIDGVVIEVEPSVPE